LHVWWLTFKKKIVKTQSDHNYSYQNTVQQRYSISRECKPFFTKSVNAFRWKSTGRQFGDQLSFFLGFQWDVHTNPNISNVEHYLKNGPTLSHIDYNNFFVCETKQIKETFHKSCCNKSVQLNLN
jgi:hypothetical protein